MDGAQLGGIPLNESTVIRLVVVLVLAIAVRQLIMWFGTKAINNRRRKSRNGKPRP
jgi:NhaP-type Na+/H+ or K+/H+ antiporter